MINSQFGTVVFQIRLTTPVNEELLNKHGMNGMMDSDEVYSSPGYMDPSNFTSRIYVRV